MNKVMLILLLSGVVGCVYSNDSNNATGKEMADLKLEADVESASKEPDTTSDQKLKSAEPESVSNEKKEKAPAAAQEPASQETISNSKAEPEPAAPAPAPTE